MNLEAKTPQEALDSITEPVMRQIKEIDYNARCNPTTFFNGVMAWFEENNDDCLIYNWLKGLWQECLEDAPGSGEAGGRIKEAHRLFRFKALHHFRLITFQEYAADWTAFWERGLIIAIRDKP